MTVQTRYRLPDELAQRWHELAERRRDHFVELYRSGRWRRYYTDEVFRALIREVIEGADAWSALIKQSGEQPRTLAQRLRPAVRAAEKPRGEKTGQSRPTSGIGTGRRRVSVTN